MQIQIEVMIVKPVIMSWYQEAVGEVVDGQRLAKSMSVDRKPI
jgi:hypothetical protein